MIDIKKEYNGPVFVREIEIRYKKKRVSKETAGRAISCPGDVVKLLHGLEDEKK